MKAKVISNIKLNDKFGICELFAEDLPIVNQAGRFFMISCAEHKNLHDPILNRPFAISDITGEKTFNFIYMIVGRGTRLLSEFKTDDDVNIVYPLGNHFNIPMSQNIAVVAGGIGIAPMVILGKYLKDNKCSTTLYYGGRKDTDILIADKLKSIYDVFIPVTEDGSLGEKGLVINPLERNIKSYDKLFACGPNRMLQAVTDIAVANNIKIDVSLDEQMGCGVGACLGCLIKMKTGVSKRCCVEGAIFNGYDIDWGELCKH